MATQTVIDGSENITARQMKEFWRQIDEHVINRKLFQDFLDRMDQKDPTIWKTIEISDRSILSLQAELKEKNLIDDFGGELLSHHEVQAIRPQRLKLALVTPRDFGINKKYWSYEQDFLTKLERDKRYFVLPPIASVYIRLQYIEQPIMQFLLVAMRRISITAGDYKRVFSIENMYNGEKLSGSSYDTSYERSLDDKWIVGVRG